MLSNLKFSTVIFLLSFVLGIIGCGGGGGNGNPNVPPSNPPPNDSPDNPITDRAQATIIVKDERFAQRTCNNGPVDLVVHIEQPNPSNPGQVNERDVVLTAGQDGNVTAYDLNPGPVTITVQIPNWGSSYGGTGFLNPGGNAVITAPSGSPEDFRYQSMAMLFSSGYTTLFHDITWNDFLATCQENFANGKSPDDVYVALIGMGSETRHIFWADFSTGEFLGNFDYKGDSHNNVVYITHYGSQEYHLVFTTGSYHSNIEFMFELDNKPKTIEITMYHLTKRNNYGERNHTIETYFNNVLVDRFSETSSDWYTQDTWTTTIDGESISSYASPGLNKFSMGRPSFVDVYSNYWLKWVRITCTY
ncbi:MAG: hypothetical protein V1807_01500 [Patescibacteria group bacterium]